MRSLVVPFLLAFAPAVASAQSDPATAAVANPGAEIRITTRVGRTFYGHLDGVSADSIRIRTPGANDRTVIAAIPRDSVVRFEINHPGGRRTVVGALVGMGAGVVVGDVIAMSNCIVFCTTEEEQQNANAVQLGTIVG